MPTGFHRPASVPEALELNATLGEATYFLAGGTELNQKHCPAQPQHLVSLEDLGLGGIAAAADAVVIGAMASFQDLLDSERVHPMLRDAASRLVNRNVRNVATVGGQLASGKSCADLVPALVVLEARVLVATLEGSGAWSVEDYVASKPQGLIIAVEVPSPASCRGHGLANFTRSANDLSVISCAVALCREGTVKTPIVAMGGVAATVIRLGAVERALVGRPLPPRLELEAVIAAAVNPIDDLRGSAAFKRQLAGSLGADAITDAFNAAEAR